MSFQLKGTEQNPKLGFYTVGDQRFYNKVEALVAATGTEHFPEWNFNREVFDAVDWLTEPGADLKELYRIRAQQLRDRYDYIRLDVSGGGDSSTVVYSFLLNNIHLDEVVFRYPKAGEKNVTDDPFNTKPENTLSEWRYAAKPLLDWIAVHSPRTKITIHDYSEDMLNSNHDESWVYRTRDYFQPGHPFKFAVDATTEHKELLNSGHSICLLAGIDKPKICIRDGNWYIYFLDIQANSANPTVGEYTNVTNEYFFWTPDLPEILVKQAHLIKNWFNLASNKYLQHLVRWPNHSFAQRTTFEQIIKPLIYPDFDPTTFQTGKPTNSFYNEMDHWFYTNFQDTHAYNVWQAGLDYLTNNVDLKFFNKELGKPVGFVGFISPFYCLGPADYISSGKNEFNRF
ncbi:hypothetical protein UFOVP190_390 [uncultured Caudovirales phage]|uniref:Uncharacterized protein n=1 Tax=uncultured Caudovirales phage TaxID=2100421 RepID=A0A6J7WHP1_9CAUD|nr:hypothetical protein UFOVP190_390 [uncultured Caudovirales phage]